MTAVHSEELLELEQYGLADAGLMDGERIESVINLGDEPDDGKGAMLLTDQRVIHIHGNAKKRSTVFASINEIDVVEVTMEREGIGAYIWAGLSFLVAILLWRVIDSELGSIAASVLVALMGVYLIVDRLMSPGTPIAVFKTGSSEIRCELPGDDVPAEIYEFTNRLFELKNQSSSNFHAGGGRFALR
jgi:hypothetical protein